MLVEQIGGPVERDGGLAGAGPALDDQHTPMGRADDLVLLGLDGLHDVVHPAGAGGVERGEQHGVAGGVLVAGARLVPEVEDLVVQAGDAAPVGTDVPASAQPHRGVPGGEIEGPGDLGPPVDEQRGAFGVVGAQSDTADVVGDAGGEIDPPETERPVDGVQRGEQPRPLGDEHVPFEPCLHRRTALCERVRDGVLGVAAQHVDPGVEPVDEFLLTPQFIVS